ncbi:MAG: PKD domain-containing protein [Bacteroidia bacterium]|nr:PKD domain-containing protein [Bacteroidia bacterium]
MRSKLFLLITFFLFYFQSYSQCPVAFPVDLSASSSAVYTQSYPTIGPLQINCCPNFSSDGNRCIKFSITLNPGSMGVRFEMNPAPSQGVYRIGCGSTAINVGSFVCLSGAGPHILTFCNPADITSLFKIVSVPRPTAGPNISISQGCSKVINAAGFDPATIIWKSVPNNPTYNGYLSCTSCLNPTIIPGSSPPAYVDYQICGSPSTSGCGPLCDTVRVYFTPPLSVTISPANPVICNGQTPNSTTINAVGLGGSGSYTYLWNNINSSQNITVPYGLYTVVLSDGTGCNATASVQVQKYTVPVSANAGTDQTVCYQFPTATLNGSVAGANGGIWSGGGIFSPNNSSLTATYTPSPLELSLGYADLTLTTTGNGTCAAATDVVRINYAGFTGTAVASVSLFLNCYGGSNGGITVSVVGGVPPYTYSWNTSPAQTASTATGLGFGNYTVTITNGIGCTTTSSATIIQPPPIALASSITNVTCSGGSNGAISIAASGGTIPYTYLWQPGNQTTASINNQTAGTYTVNVTDSKGCQKSSSYTITQPNLITIALTPTPVSCFNGIDGTANSTVSGGASPYTYNWSSGATSPNASGLSAGTYTLNVTDNLGCLVSNTVNVTQPATAAATITIVNETCSYLNNGTATVVSTGGSAPYTYLWQPGAQTTGSISNLSSGTYTLTSVDSRGCTITSFATITEPAPLVINFISQVNVSCFGGTNGIVTASPAGGTPNYTYLWAPGGATTANRNSLPAGTYTVTVTDSKGCSATNSVTITEPVAPLAISPTITDVTCNGVSNGAIAISPSGGTASYTYLWQPGNQTNQQITGLAAGTYTVTVKDSKACPISSNYTVIQPAPTLISFTPTHVSCVNGTDGAVSAILSGGNSPFTYSWNNGATTAQISNLTSQTYTLTALDYKGCSTTNTVAINQPVSIALNPLITHIVCSGGSSGAISLSPTGGNTPYTYLWSTGATTAQITNLSIGTYSVTVTDSKGCQTITNYTVTQLTLSVTLSPSPVTCFGGNNGSISALPSGGTPNFTYSWLPGSASTNAISNLTAGTYTLSVTDSKGCVATSSVTLTQPNAVSASTSSTNETCNYLNNGTATAIPSGGTSPYTYLWQPALQTTGTVSNLQAGTYTLTVTDSNECTATTTAIITQPIALAIGITGQTNVSTCFGDNNGAITATASGGTPTYTYSWMPGSATTSTISNLTAGTYTLTLSDLNGCSVTKPVVITQPSIVSASTTKTNETCSYLNNGTATATAVGGSSPYTYLWSNGATTSLATTLSSQTYTVTATDSKGCAANALAVISEPALLVANFTGQINVSCLGGSNGTVSVTPNGGTPNYTYLWAPGGTTSATKNNLQVGTYTVTVTDGKGCTATNSVSITEPAALSANATITNETCNNLNNGTATAVPSGGTSGYTYLWKPGLQTTSTISNLQASTYTLIVTDSRGCTATSNAIVAEPSLLAINFTGQINISTCFGDNTGSVTGTPTGGNPAYTYSWAPGAATTASISNLTAGTYTLTVLDNLGCSAIKPVIITEPTQLSAIASSTNESCSNLNNGTSTVVVTGGTPGSGYTYLWQPGGQTSNSITGLSANTYTITTTDSKGCISTTQAIVTEPVILSVNFSGQTDASCFGGNNGVITSIPAGGTPNYTYLWAPGGATTGNRNNLAAGTHTLTITDSRGCTASNSVVITEPAVLSATTTTTIETCSYSNNGTATAVPSGGSPGYTYSWQPGFQTTVTKTALAAGTYTLTVKDSKGCSVTALAIVTEPPVLAINFTSQVNVSCKGGNNGSVTASPTGGTSGYTYLWSPGGATTASRTNLIAGTYSVTVTDSKGCTVTKPVIITQPNLLIASTTKNNETCNNLNNGTATATCSGGTASYSYLWQPGAFTTSTITNLSAGTYSVTSTDSKGCTATSTAIITEPATLAVSFSAQTNVSCFGGSNGAVAASGTGGTLNYTYSWAPGGATTNSVSNFTAGTKTVTITDSKGCTATNSVIITQPAALVVSALPVSPTCYQKADGSITASATGGSGAYTYTWITPTPSTIIGQTVSNTRAGIYTVTVRDGNTCTNTNSFTIAEPPPMILTITVVNSACNSATGSASVAVTNGTPAYSYLWSTGGTNSSIINLVADAYSVTVTDANGCKATQFANVNDDLAPTASIALTMPSCYGYSDGTITVNTVGGTGTFSYLWLPSGGTNATATGLSTGTYTVKVTDSNGCKSSDTDSLYQPTPVLLSTTSNPVSCFGGANGSASSITLGGTPGYTYQWLPGGTTTSGIINRIAGTYTINVTDSKGCTQTNTATIGQPAAPVAVSISSFSHVSCFGGNDGSASATSATGGNGGAFLYNWMPGNINGKNASTLSAATYTVTAKDYKGCTGTAITTITEPTLLSQSFSNQTNVSCYGGNNGSVASNASGGTSGYTYLWKPGGETTTSISSLIAGTDTIIIVDLKGCILKDFITIIQPTQLLASTSSTNTTCNYYSNGTAKAIHTGGTPPYTYLWQPGGFTADSISNLSIGTYSLTVTDSFGCSANATAVITEPAQLGITFSNQVDVSCFGGSDGSISALASGGTLNYNYSWMPGAMTTSSLSNLTLGTFTLTVTDTNNCLAQNSVTITQPSAALTNTLSNTPVSCFGGSDGSISAITSGGTSQYNYSYMPGNLNGENPSNLSSGSYTLTVTDSKGCVFIDSTTITQATPLMLSTDSINSNCSFANGQASVSVSGGTGFYLYQWTPSGGTNSSATALLSGSYTVSVSDSNACIATKEITVNDNPIPVATIYSTTNVSCTGGTNGTASATVSGTSGPFTYSWLPIGGTDSIGTGLSIGSYTLTVTDTNLCQSIPVISQEITEPNPIYISVTTSPLSCFGGSDGNASAIATGGTPGYAYKWLPSGTTGTSITNLSANTYNIQVTDTNSCVQTTSFTIVGPSAFVSNSLTYTPVSCFGGGDGSVSASASGGTAPYDFNWMPGNYNAQTLFNLTVGTYTVTIFDANGCSIMDSITITQPTPLILTSSGINAKCDLPNGQASVSVAGGIAPYIYQWSNAGETTATITDLLPGTYTVSVADSNACPASTFVTVIPNPSPIATVIATTNVSCTGGSDGTATVSVSGSAAGPFTYSWLPSGNTGSIASGLSAGTYTVTVTDANLCVSLPEVSPEITEPSPILITISKTAVSCFGNTNGGASAIASGGTPGYTYLWLPGGTTGTSLSNLSANSYTIQVTDTNSCVKTTPFIITEPMIALSASPSFTPVSCFGGSDGTVSASASGGTPPYNYFWMPGSLNGKNQSNLTIGTYTVSIVDSKGCTLIDSTIVTQPTLMILTPSSISSNCSVANGQASVSASGGTGSYLYQWSPAGGTNATTSALLSGTYSVLVTDSNLCAATTSVTINDNPSPIATVFSTTNVSCSGGANGTASAIASGNSGPFTYSWLPSGGTDSVATGLLPGTYSVTVTDANLCQSLPAISPVITEPTPISITISASTMSCFGGNNETASASATGGTPGYTYQWLPSGTLGSTISNLSANTYTLQVTDTKNCLQSELFTIAEPSLLTASISSTVNVSCFGGNNGTATVIASGGTPVYGYSWSPTGGNGPTGTVLASGTYTITITDLNGCITTDSAIITQPSQALSATSTVSNITCFGLTNGTAKIVPVGGTPGFSYQWNPSVSISDTASGLSVGNYNIMVTDTNSCQTNLSLSISQPAVLGGTLASVNPSCNLSNGSITPQISGGTYPYTYLWSPGASTNYGINGLAQGNYSVQITDALNCSLSLSASLTDIPVPILSISSIDAVSCFGGSDGSSTITISQGVAPYAINWSPSGGNSLTATSLTSDTYTVTIIDASGCEISDSAVVTEPTPIDLSALTVNDVLCYGGNSGSISIVPSGGTGPLYTYSWAPVSSSSSTASNLAIGTYTLNVTDQNNCISSISVNIAQPTPFSSTIDSIINPICFNGYGSATAIASGGMLPYSYFWSPSSDSVSKANNIKADSYTVTVTDANGCTSSNTLVLTQPTQVITSTGVNDTVCVGQTGIISATAIGGLGNYYYGWQPSGAITSGTLPITPTSDVTYTVVAYDQNGCAGTPATTDAIVYTLDTLSVHAYATSPICPGQSSVVYVETLGTTGTLTYQWNNNLGTGPGVYLVTPSAPTMYIVTVSNVCSSVTDSAAILFNPPPTIALTSDTSALCVPGTIQFFDNSVTGNPNDPITIWNWSFGDGTSSTLEDPPHSYTIPSDYQVTLTITTSGGCTNSTSTPLIINGHPFPVAAFSLSSTELDLPYDVLLCNNQSTGAITYNWSFGDGETSTLTNPQYLYTTIGIYPVQLIAMTEYGCLDTAYSEVTTNAEVKFPNAFTPNPDGTSGGFFDINSLDNNIFFPYTSGVVEYKLEVYNRWGEIIFETQDSKQGWDGYYKNQLCPQDVYIWRAFIKLNNGKIFNKNGNLTLLR